jgi:uracil-DNA glycosylase
MSNQCIPSTSIDALLTDIKACRLCEQYLPYGARPVVQLNESAKILIVGQAPGRRVHGSGIPWEDPSGNRLREWMRITKESFYDSNNIAIMPMGFC